jgi:hypothetical protein
VLVNYPTYGRLDVYLKSDTNRGAIVICEEDGGRYGVTKGILNYFSKPGNYGGWAYVNPERALVFKFIVGGLSDRPEGIVAVEAASGRVACPASNANVCKYVDSTLVAFYGRFVRRKGSDRYQREATDIFAIDANHLPLIARLIGGGKLAFPDHNEVLEIFFEALASTQRQTQQNLSLFDSALAFLAGDANVPSQFQTLARVERCKLSAVDVTRRTVPHNVQRPLQDKRPEKAAKSKPNIRQSHKGSFVDDIMRVNLRIKED